MLGFDFILSLPPVDWRQQLLMRERLPETLEKALEWEFGHLSYNLRSTTYPLDGLGEKVAIIQFSSVAQSCLTLWDPTNHSMPGLPVHYQLPEFIQTHVHWVCDDIQPSHPLSSPSPPALSPSQHQGLFQWIRSLHQVAKVLEFQLQHLPKNTQDWSPIGWTGWISLQSKGLSRVFSNTAVQKHQFFGTQLSL